MRCDKRISGTKGSLLLAVLMTLCCGRCMAAISQPPKDIGDPKVRESLFTARVITCPDPHVDVLAEWDFAGPAPSTALGAGMWPLTHRDPNCQNLRVEDGVLKFTLGAPKVTLGFGNFAFGDATARKMLSFRGTRVGGARIEIKRRQSKPVSGWALDFRYHGDPKDAGTWGEQMGWDQPSLQARASEKVGEWETVSLGCNQVAEADGMGLEISGDIGTEVEIDEIRIFRLVDDIYARKTFEIPKEPIFSAIATIAAATEVWVNGRQAWRSTEAGGGFRYEFVPVDLSRYLRPGKNVIAIHEFIPGIAFVGQTCYLQGAVQLVSGKSVPIETDLTWKSSAEEEPGWTEVDFDDSHWAMPSKLIKPSAFNPARIPAYCGQVSLRNPDGKKVYYNDQKPVRFEVRLPAGLASRKPTVEYAIWSQMTKEKVKEGRAAGGKAEGNALVYEINAGGLGRGVYSLLLDAAGGQDPQLARQETFVVVGKIPMPETDGRSWDADMKLTLVDEINCADANDPHEFCDAGALKPEFASKIVTRNGMTYREAAFDPGSQYSWFGYKFKFKHLDRPHWVVIEYPDDAPRMMEVALSPLKRDPRFPTYPDTAWAMPGCQVGEKYPNTNRLQPLRFLVWSHYLDGALLITRGGGAFGKGPGAGAAAAKITIYEIDQLPALRTNPAGRRFGLMTERHTVMNRTYAGNIRLDPPPRDPYVEWMKVAEKYAQYCRFTGQNVYFMGCYQYNRLNSGMTWDMGDEGCSLVPDEHEFFIPVLGANGIDTISAIEYRVNWRYWHDGWPALHQALKGADLMFQVDKNGIDHGGNYQWEN